jgi:hypothetical protein
LEEIEYIGDGNNQATEVHRLLRNLISEVAKSSFLIQNILRQRRGYHSNRLFLEAILRIVGHASISPPSKHLQDLPSLGILFQGMGLWDFSIADWDALGEHQDDTDAVDIIVKSAIAAMNLEHQRLRVEVQQLLSEQVCYIEELYRFQLERDKKRKNIQYFSFYKRIPKVPANPQWERVKEINISIQTMEKALDHPSAIIRCHAILILTQRIGRDQTAKIMKSKDWDNELVHSFLTAEGITEL